MELIETEQGGVAAVQVTGRIDSTTAASLQARLTDLVHSGCTGLIVDFEQVAYISSAGFRALLIAAKAGESRHCTLTLCGIAGEVRRTFEMGALDQVFTILGTREECAERLMAGPKAA